MELSLGASPMPSAGFRFPHHGIRGPLRGARKGRQGCKNPENSEMVSAEVEGRDPMGKCIPSIAFVQN